MIGALHILGQEHPAVRAYSKRHGDTTFAKQSAHLDEFVTGWLDSEAAAAQELRAARERIGALEGALEWYADAASYDVPSTSSVNRYDRWPVVQDRGERARKALARPEPAAPVGVAERCRGCAQPVICSCPPRRPAEPVAGDP